MRLFQVSEDSTITEFIPRFSERIQNSVVWAIDEKHLPNYLTPRNCPRVTYKLTEGSSNIDKEKFFSGNKDYVVTIENIYQKAKRNTVL